MAGERSSQRPSHPPGGPRLVPGRLPGIAETFTPEHFHILQGARFGVLLGTREAY
jgi:hypothetical protein